MKNKLFKCTIGLCATMMACTPIAIRNIVPTNPGIEYAKKDSGNVDDMGNSRICSPQNDDENLVKPVK